MRPSYSYSIVLGLALAACSPPPGAARLEPGAGPAADDSSGSASLAIGESAEVGGLSVTFTGIDGDNRCPKTVQCIVGGQAGVLLAVQGSSGNSTELRIEVPPDATASGNYEGYEIEVDLEPETKASEPIDPDSYVAHLTVSRSASEDPLAEQ